MKTKDIAKNCGIDNTAFDQWLPGSGYTYKTGMLGGLDVDDRQNIQEIVSSFKQHLAQEQERIAQEQERIALEQERIAREQADLERAAQQKRASLASMLITSGFSFDGYAITKYSGYISGDDSVQIDRGTSGVFARATDVGASLMASLVEIRRNALAELKEAAYALGCNAVIGVDFDYLTLDPETATSGGGTMYLPYVFGITANGNAVIIEKNDRTGLS
ncbi:heavy metal-binding domain-containing protein [Variovorax sp. LjRoot130]|uniref:YbjQ family protein n=1 Tax=Variovorax sp. LjRoot130 TaxID=3342261 RepID=UPI003ECE0638